MPASYAKQANDDELMKMATRIRDRAIRRAGELLKQVDPSKEWRPSEVRVGVRGVLHAARQPPTLDCRLTRRSKLSASPTFLLTSSKLRSKARTLRRSLHLQSKSRTTRRPKPAGLSSRVSQPVNRADGLRMPAANGQCMLANCDRNHVSLRHWIPPLAWLEPGRKWELPLGLLLCYHQIMSSKDKKIAKKRGRPATGTSQTIGVRSAPELVTKIDEWRSTERPIPSLPEAIRRLVELGLKVKRK